MSGAFEAAQWVPYPVELVFGFFSDPENLPRLMDPASATCLDWLKRVDAAGYNPPAGCTAAGVGSELAVSFRPLAWLPLRRGWVARIVEFAPGRGIADEQVRGPFKSFHHRHEMESCEQNGVMGTQVTDRIHFTLPGGVLGKLAEPWIQAQMHHAFAIRQQRLAPLLAALVGKM